MTEWRTLAGALAEELTAAGKLRSPRWQATIRAVPRHELVPRHYTLDPHTREWTAHQSADDLALVYSNTALFVLPGGLSSTSMPGLMTRMLEALDVHDGHRVLEIGAGTGYNAALLSHRLGSEQRLLVPRPHRAPGRYLLQPPRRGPRPTPSQHRAARPRRLLVRGPRRSGRQRHPPGVGDRPAPALAHHRRHPHHLDSTRRTWLGTFRAHRHPRTPDHLARHPGQPAYLAPELNRPTRVITRKISLRCTGCTAPRHRRNLTS